MRRVIAFALALAGCDRPRQASGSPSNCGSLSSDSAHAACVALDTATRLTRETRKVHEFRRDSLGFSILTLPVKPTHTDGDLTVHVSKAFNVNGFGPDSA